MERFRRAESDHRFSARYSPLFKGSNIVFAEDHVRLYHTHLDAVLYLRLLGLLLLMGTLAALVQINSRDWLKKAVSS